MSRLMEAENILAKIEILDICHTKATDSSSNKGKIDLVKAMFPSVFLVICTTMLQM